MKVPVALLASLAMLSHAQQAPRASATPTHFRWSEFEAHELDYGRTIKTSPELSPAEKVSLTNAIVLQLKSDLNLKEVLDDLTDDQVRNLAEDTRIELADLNGDGNPEIIAQANGLGPCGGTGNCVFWIFQRTSKGLTILLNTEEWSPVIFEKILIRPWSTNGYKDIVLGSHSNATSRNLVWFQFTRGAYRIHACYYLTWVGDRGQPLRRPAISQEDCSKSVRPIR